MFNALSTLSLLRSRPGPPNDLEGGADVPVPVLPDTVTDQHTRSRRPRPADMEVDDTAAADQRIRRRPRPEDMEVDDTEAAKAKTAEHPRAGVDKVRIIEHPRAEQEMRRQETLIRELEGRLLRNEEVFESFKKQLEDMTTKAALAEEQVAKANEQIGGAEKKAMEAKARLDDVESKAREVVAVRVSEAEAKAKGEAKARIEAEDRKAMKERAMHLDKMNEQIREAERRAKEAKERIEVEERTAREEAAVRVREAEAKARQEVKVRIEAEEREIRERVEAQHRANEERERLARVEDEGRKQREIEARLQQAEEQSKKFLAQLQEERRVREEAENRLREEKKKAGKAIQKQRLLEHAIGTTQPESQGIDCCMEDATTGSVTPVLSDRPMAVDQEPRTADESNEELVHRSTIPKPIHFDRPVGGAGPRYRLKSKATGESSPFSVSKKPHMTSKFNATRESSPFHQPVSKEPLITTSQDQSLSSDQRLDILQTTVEKLCHALGPSVQTRRKGPRPAFNPPITRHRKEARTAQLAYIRGSMNGFLGINHDKDILALTTTKEMRQTIDNFEEREGEGPGPTLDPMRPNWEVLHGYWNCRIFDLFLEEYNDENEEDVEADSEIGREMYSIFFERLYRLQRRIVQSQPKDDEDATKAQQRVKSNIIRKQRIQRPHTRRQTLFDTRRTIAHSHITGPGSVDDERAVWDEFEMLIEKLGPEGMSSDDSEVDDDGRKEFKVRRMPWRSKEIEKRLIQVDKDRNMTNAYGNSRAGNQPRHRTRRNAMKVSRRKPSAGYPLNFYDDDWYAELTRSQQEDLAATHSVDWLNFEAVL